MQLFGFFGSLLTIPLFAALLFVALKAAAFGYRFGKDKIKSELTLLKLNVLGGCSIMFTLACFSFDSNLAVISMLASILISGTIVGTYKRMWSE